MYSIGDGEDVCKPCGLLRARVGVVWPLCLCSCFPTQDVSGLSSCHCTHAHCFAYFIPFVAIRKATYGRVQSKGHWCHKHDLRPALPISPTCASKFQLSSGPLPTQSILSHHGLDHCTSLSRGSEQACECASMRCHGGATTCRTPRMAPDDDDDAAAAAMLLRPALQPPDLRSCLEVAIL
jgi:hypothetical protein